MSKKSGFILLMVFIVLILGIYIYPSIKNDNYQKRLISDIYKNTDIKDIEYLNKDNNYYVVKSGDTLWSIAENEIENNKYFENKEIRAVVDELRTVNNFKSSELYEGEKIKIPMYK